MKEVLLIIIITTTTTATKARSHNYYYYFCLPLLLSFYQTFMFHTLWFFRSVVGCYHSHKIKKIPSLSCVAMIPHPHRTSLVAEAR